MSDVEISVGLKDDTGAGVRSITASMDRLKGAVGSFGGAGVASTGIMENWTKAQWKAVEVGGKLTDRATILGKAVDRGKITIEQAQMAWQRYNAEAQKAIWNNMSMGEKLGAVADKWKAAKTAVMPFIQMGAAAAGALYGVGKAAEVAFNFSREGAQIEFTQKKFSNLSASIGTTSHALLYDLKKATKGVYSDMELMGSATDFVGLGLAKTHDEAVRLSAVAAGLGMNMNQLVLTLTNKTTMRFDALGVKVDGFKEKVKGLQDLGMSKDDAFKEAFLQQAEAQLALVGGVADTNLGKFMQMQSAWKNYWDSVKVDTAGAFSGVNAGLANYFNLGATQRTTRANFADQLASIGVDRYSMFQQTTGRGQGSTYSEDAFNNAAKAYSASASRYQGLANYYAAGGNVPGGGATVDYKGLLTNGLQLTQINEQFSNATNELNAKLAEETQLLEQLRERGYSETNPKIQEQIEKINQLRQAVIQTSEAQVSASEQTALSVLKNKEATDEQMLSFALASGQISQSAYDQSVAQQMLADAFMEGTITAQEYADIVSNIDGILSSLDGKDVKSKITIAIETKGNAGLLGIIGLTQTGMSTAAAVGNTAIGANGNQRMGGAVGDNWAGGPLVAGGWTLVGDKPGGVFVDGVSELISPWGYVYDSATSKKLLESGMVGASRSLALGGDVYTPGGTSTSTTNGLTKSNYKGNPKAGAYRAARFAADTAAYSGIGASPAMFEQVQSVQEVLAQQTASVQMAQQAMIQSTTALTGALNNKLDEVVATLTGANPRMIGQQVFGSFAANS